MLIFSMVRILCRRFDSFHLALARDFSINLPRWTSKVLYDLRPFFYLLEFHSARLTLHSHSWCPTDYRATSA